MIASYLAPAGDFVGVPYVPDGRDPTGWDCIGLVGWLRQTWWNKPTPGFENPWPEAHQAPRGARAEAVAAIVSRKMGAWRAVEQPAAGVVVLLGVNNAAGHVGLMLDRVHFIHADGAATGTVISRIDRSPWDKPGRVKGFFDV